MRPQDEIDRRRLSILNWTSIAASLAGGMALVYSLVQSSGDPAWWPRTLPFLAAYLLTVAVSVLRGLPFRLRVAGLLLAGYLVAALSMASLGLLGSGLMFLLVCPALGVLLLDTRSGLLLAGVSLAAYGAFTVAAWLGWLDARLVVRDNSLELSRWLSHGFSFALLVFGLVTILAWLRQAQALVVARLSQSTGELSAARDELMARSDDLTSYAHLLETMAGISRELSVLVSREDLLQRAVHLIAERLALDSVVIYLAGDVNSPDLRLAAGAGPKGDTISSAELGDEQPGADIARAVRNPQEGAAWIGVARGLKAVHTVLPGTGGQQLALPLRVDGQVMGVLVVQMAGREEVHLAGDSRSSLGRGPGARLALHGEHEIAAWQGMADQLAAAMQNARLLTKAEANLQELRAAYQHYTGEAWAVFAGQARLAHTWQAGSGSLVRTNDRRGAKPAARVPGDAWRPVFEEARAGGRSVVQFSQEHSLYLMAVPIKQRDLQIGVLGFCRPADAGPWSVEQVAAVEAVAERVALTAENLRLLDATQRRAARERLVEYVAGQVQASLDPDVIMKTAVRELGRALGARLATIEITGVQPDGADG